MTAWKASLKSVDDVVASRAAASPTVVVLLSGQVRSVRETGQIPKAIGVDALRAWLFALVRSSRFVGTLGPDLTVKDDYFHPAIPDILRMLREGQAQSA